MKLTRLDYVTIAMAVAVPALAYFGYFKGRLAQFQQLEQAKTELEEKTAGQSRTGVDLAVVRKNTRLIEQRLTDFFGSMTGQDEANMAVNAVLQNAKDAGVDIQLIRPGAPVEGKTLNCLPIDLTASAAFPQLYDFLVRIEHGRTVITVSRMELESDALSETCTVKLQLRVYFVNATPGGTAGKEARA